jgi:mannitol/fructose-specific phosphotransferase system IIA component (Ntr-type)
MEVHSLLTEDMILPEIVSQERDAVLGEMVHFLKNKGAVVNDIELSERLMQREKLGSTVIGKGVAIPHCKLEEVRTPLLALAVSKRGVDFASVDGKLTHVFFLVITPLDDPSLNLQILASIARLLRKSPSLQKKILGAIKPQKMVAIIRQEEKKRNE